MALPDPLDLTTVPAVEQERQRSQAFRERMAERRNGKKIEPPSLPPLPKTETTGRTHLVIGDSHTSPDTPNHRFEWLGRKIVDLQPDVIIDIGDWWDMHSLNAYDRAGSRSFEGRRYWQDIEAGIDAMERVQYQLDEYNRGRRKKYRPRMIRTLGNHEYRIIRLLEDEPRWDAMVGLHDLMSAEFGWEEVPFRQPIVVDGIAYCHYFASGVMGRPIGGENPATMLLKKQFHSCVQGHSHVLDYSERTDATGKKIAAMHAGCYFGHELGWAGPEVNRMYARGLLTLRNVWEGHFDLDWTGIDRIQERYS